MSKMYMNTESKIKHVIEQIERQYKFNNNYHSSRMMHSCIIHEFILCPTSFLIKNDYEMYYKTLL